MAEFRELQGRMEEAYRANRAVAESDPTWPVFVEAKDAYLAFLQAMRDEASEPYEDEDPRHYAHRMGDENA